MLGVRRMDAGVNGITRKYGAIGPRMKRPSTLLRPQPIRGDPVTRVRHWGGGVSREHGRGQSNRRRRRGPLAWPEENRLTPSKSV